ncbi:hypothetical protein EDB86DRAFT_3084607 [Lactarius hatsudake]|nr:hypothetical protein EDB86DRAFT_3084607 [Lactarius hatsudake]
MTDPWPQWLVQSFLSANQPQFATTDECVYYGPYTCLLYYLFDAVESPFEVSPQYHIPQIPRESIDIIALFTVELNKHPDFFIQEMRNHFRDLVVSNNRIALLAIRLGPDILNDVAPIK